MPSYLAFYEDSAPFLTYSGAWGSGFSAADSSLDQYSENSFTLTNVRGSSLSFTFYGTQVTIYGAMRSNHGKYQVTLDGVAAPPMSGSMSPDQFKQVLYSATVQTGLHNVTVMNMEDLYLDIDSVSWMGSVGSDNEPIIVNTYQDSHPSFVYTPSAAWTTSPPSVESFSGASGHGSWIPTASVQLSFEGEAIALYGPSGPNCAPSYSVQIGDQPPTTHSSLRQAYRSRQLLYYRANLGPGIHNMTVTLGQGSGSQMLAIDYAEVYTAPSLGGSYGGGVLVTNLKPSGKLSTGVILGFVTIGLVALLALSLLLVMYRLYKKGRLTFIPSPQRVEELGPNAARPFGLEHEYSHRPIQGLPYHNREPMQYIQSNALVMNLAQNYSTSTGLSNSHPPRGSPFRVRSTRKDRTPLQPTSNQDLHGSSSSGAAPAATVPPPAYLS